MLILKHLFDWSYDDLEQEVRANLVYRAFTRIDADEVPDAKTILKIAGALGPEVVAQLHRQVVDVAKRAGVTRGRRFRIDTTVVETNVHYPTDSTLLQDGVRVLTRTMQRASAALGDPPGAGAESAPERDPPGPDDRLPGAVAEDAGRVDRQLPETDGHDPRRAAGREHHGASDRPRPSARRRRRVAILDRARVHLQRMRPLVERVVHQTRARLLGGDTHVPDKVLSLFEPHTTTIRKGKISKPNEFGNLVTIQESEHQIITAYEVHTGRPADVTLWTPGLDRHQASSAARHIWRRAIAASAPRPTNRRPRIAGCDASCSPGADRSPRADGPTSGKPGSGAANAGVSAVKGASV